MSNKLLQIEIRNLTLHPVTRTSMSLSSGQWAGGSAVPPNNMPAGSTAIFAIESTSELSGVQGQVVFHGGGSTFEIDFEMPFIGDNKVSVRVPTGNALADVVGDLDGDRLTVRVILEPPE